MQGLLNLLFFIRIHFFIVYLTKAEARVVEAERGSRAEKKTNKQNKKGKTKFY